MNNPSIFISAGEPSGDALAAGVVRCLGRSLPGARFFGAGGDELAAAGVEVRHHIHGLAVTGLSEALARAGGAGKMLLDLALQARHRGPALALLVDYPGINLRLARILHRLGTPVLYYVAPQRWAWLGWRLGGLRQHVDRLAVTLPFEEAWFRQRGVAADFVGHPALDLFRPTPRGEARRRLGCDSRPVVALLPGSRVNEARRHLPLLIQTAALLGEEIQPVLAVVPGPQESLCADLAPGIPRAPASVALGGADLTLCASGTATLEAALAGVPAVVFYRLSRLSHAVARRLVKVRWISLPNLLLGAGLLPELIQDAATPRQLAAQARRLLQPAVAREIRAGYGQIRALLGEPGASERVAAIGLEMMGLALSVQPSSMSRRTTSRRRWEPPPSR